MFRKYGKNWLPYENQILRWAKAYNVDPAYVAAVLLRENASASPGAVSATGALGPGQIQDTTVDNNLNPQFTWDGPTQLSAAWKTNFANAIKYVAWRVSGAVNHYGSLDAAYAGSDGTLRGYNPGFTGVGPSQFLPKGYIPSATPTPSDNVPGSVAASTARADLTDPWVVLTKKGKITTVTGAQPKNALTYGKQALRLSDFNTIWKQTYQTIWQAYSGKPATGAQIAGLLKNAPSTTTLATALAAEPGFVNSPTYKAHGPGLVADAKAILGVAPPKKLVANAIAQNWDQATFEANLKALPQYKTGPQYKTNYAQLQTTYQQIYGRPDKQGEAWLDHATMNGWSTDQAAAALRAAPEYKYSPEYQAKTVNFLDAMGLFIGARPTLTPGQAAPKVAAGEPGAALNLVAGLGQPNPVQPPPPSALVATASATQSAVPAPSKKPGVMTE